MGLKPINQLLTKVLFMFATCVGIEVGTTAEPKYFGLCLYIHYLLVFNPNSVFKFKFILNLK
jgi:hypothetical protein